MKRNIKFINNRIKWIEELVKELNRAKEEIEGIQVDIGFHLCQIKYYMKGLGGKNGNK